MSTVFRRSLSVGLSTTYEAGSRAEAKQVGHRKLQFSVMLTRGGAVRWFKVTRAPEPAAGTDGA